jgi:hypothetical protein
VTQVTSKLSLSKQGRFKRSSPYHNKQVAIRTYSKQLGKKLQERYGVRATYPPDRIKATIRESGWSGDRDCYGIAMYADRTDFIEYHRSIGEVCDYDAMRSEISECLSLPDNTFSTDEAIEAGALITESDPPVGQNPPAPTDIPQIVVRAVTGGVGQVLSER